MLSGAQARPKGALRDGDKKKEESQTGKVENSKRQGEAMWGNAGQLLVLWICVQIRQVSFLRQMQPLARTKGMMGRVRWISAPRVSSLEHTSVEDNLSKRLWSPRETQGLWHRERHCTGFLGSNNLSTT